MNMKTKNRTSLWLALAALMAFTACGKLEPTDYTDLNTTIIPRTEKDVAALVDGVYHPFQSSWWDGMFACNDRGIIWFADASVDILTNTWGVQKACNEFNFTVATGDLTRFYYASNPYLNLNADCRDEGYVNDMNGATLLIDQISNADFLSQEKKDAFLAVVRCARGLLGYTLFDLYGPVSIAPLDMLKSPLKSEPVARMPYDAMVKFIEEDLQFAAAHLPSPAKAAYGRFSSGLAKMLLVRLYLHEAKDSPDYYEKAENVVDDLMSAENGYALMPSYPGMFELGGQGAENKEIIFAVPTRRSDSNSWNDWHGSICPSDFGHGIWEGTSGYGTTSASWAFYDSFEEGDFRRTYLLGSYYTKKGELIERGNKKLERGAIPCKFGPVPNYNGAVEKQDIIIYRYADAILAKAECLYLKPGSSDADKRSSLGYLNQIRKRAGLKDLTFEDIDAKEEFIDRLILERKHEFWCENGQVRADVIRLGRWGGPEHTQLYPLPEVVIIDGRGKVEQNPGF